jgi:endonuclease YncB( thermonuclease family)
MFLFQPMRLPPSVLLAMLFTASLWPGAHAAPQSTRQQVGPTQGVVSRVVDGDSLWFTAQGRAPVEVRLADMDAPELCQAHGAEARQALAELVLNQPAQLRGVARDSYGRLVARITVAGTDVATRMVEQGHAWSARQRNDRGPLVKQERMARALGRGLHAGGGAVLPREFRRTHGPCRAAQPTAPSAGSRP